MAVRISEYKGNPIIHVPYGEYQGEVQEIGFGVRKAKAILDHIDEIEQFVIEQEEARSAGAGKRNTSSRPPAQPPQQRKEEEDIPF